MDITDELRAFVATAQTGSFTAAAEQMGISNRLTSKYVAELEARLGVRLFQRTTRKVGLTPAGEDLLARAPLLLADLDDLLSEVSEGSKGFTGVIRISAPVTFGEIYVGGMLARFGAAHPGLSFDLRLSDRYVDLATEGIDLGLRIGQSQMLSVKARKLGEFRSALVASPAYLDRAGTPQTPEDLAHHACIIDTNRRDPRRWRFHHGDQVTTVQVQGRFQVNSARTAVALAAAGHGIAFVPRFTLGLDPSVCPILETHVGDTVPLSAIYLEGRALPRKIRALIDFAAADLRAANIF